MTKEELRKEATTTVEWECTPMIDRPLFVHAYIAGAEPREKRIADLEAQIEKLNSQNKVLEEAKEIIKTFLGFAEAFSYSPSMDKFITEAEQFLKEAEK